ncbi:16S rRNA (cytidine(1402)-2'-O)-methyltransferase [Lactobacillus sp. DCY120]|uniref:Ribosomal RNA small subunit methyltransferase I n=1 Tax=Bombilactobacillus apium TaxID=2675299 RepID=A0A850R1S0_9LACO|nr:16S rRNA (cytidine(1402)-2'-O)-methyltransferase [Bombilactobacillus apium]NVY95971.1 16S rRNA (cytidine(1402)-2'-O)-methyltransferase [Bombilactobacillus apium]
MITEVASFKASTSGRLYLVPTPIGNLGDLSPRAVEVLQTVDLIAAEDTRNTQKLLNHFQIKTKQISFHEHNTQQRLPELVAKLKQGLQIAQVSDAGMPSISDPGQELVQACIQVQIPVVPLTGPNAALTALIASGLVPQPFYFYGFLPRKQQEWQAALAQLKNLTATFILYESPYRIQKTVEHLGQVLGTGRQLVLARELTKVHEAFLRGTIGEVQEYFAQNQPRGEYVVLVQGQLQTVEKTWSELEVQQEVQSQIQAGQKPNVAIKTVAKQAHWERQAVYNLYHGLE